MPDGLQAPENSAECISAEEVTKPARIALTKQEGIDGFGVVTEQYIPKDSFIGCIHGEVISHTRMKYRKRERRAFQFWWPIYPGSAVSWRYYVDTSVYRNRLACINHSCDPNAEFIVMWCAGKLVLAVFALKTIKKSEFITFNYYMDTPKELKKAFPAGCKCNSKNCNFPPK